MNDPQPESVAPVFAQRLAYEWETGCSDTSPSFFRPAIIPAKPDGGGEKLVHLGGVTFWMIIRLRGSWPLQPFVAPPMDLSQARCQFSIAQTALPSQYYHRLLMGVTGPLLPQ